MSTPTGPDELEPIDPDDLLPADELEDQDPADDEGATGE